MNDDASNTKSRKMASRLMLGTAVLALPLTASVTYAESLAPVPPTPPAVTALAPTPPAPPAPPAVLGLVQAAPEAPEPPEPPQPPQPGEEREVTTIVTVDPDTGETKTVDIKGDGKRTAKYVVKDKNVMILHGEDGETPHKSRYKTVKIVNRGEKMDEAELELVLKEVREEMAEVDKELKELHVELEAMEGEAEWTAMAKEGRTVVKMECDSRSDEVATTKELKDGTTKVMICQSRIMAHALEGLKQARAAIADNPEIDGKMRKEILKELDSQIKSWRKDAR